MNWQERIVTDPELLTGKPIIKGTRISVEWIIELLASEWSIDEILRNYPGIGYPDVMACLRYASEAM